ncbi:MAG: hypothetical protein M4579_001322 [Chaenotheca gracillima]|nr:MAG: hypothetical protein M4579_001322 [Chaenotheca gracillima]
MDSKQSGASVPSAFDSPTFTLDMSIRVDQPVGSMSISPSGRDVVLASRQGLHIIDLDSPYSPPRHLPHHTPWEVADVQWSPFAVRDYWVISTSNQKALVWNLAMAAPYNAIEHVLHAHTRAITDINFSAHHPDVLATCAVDSFVHCWDLRNPFRPSMTFCDWFAGATQVKWNRLDPHIIASSHDKFLRIWDNRKGAYPLRSIEAHDTKIYGIDWNRTGPTSLATCSLDKSIKFWDYAQPEDEPERVIRTPFPVWRARHTPFGSGMLAMPQRENCDLHLYDRRLTEDTPRDGAVAPVHKFEGHQNQVKEFLWRPRGTFIDDVDHREFQLVSWGTDRDLHLHRVEDDTLRKVGYEKGKSMRRKFNFTRRNATYKSFREDVPRTDRDGHSRPTTSHGFMHDQGFSSALGGALNASMKKAPIPLSRGWADGGFMTSRTGKDANKRTKGEPTAIEWLKGVRIGKKPAHEGLLLQSGASRSRPRPDPLSLRNNIAWDSPESLGDEVTHVADKFSKVSFDEVNMSKRLVVVSMNGPWGEGGKLVYIQVNARFPEDYPETSAPEFKMEKTSSISDHTLSRIDNELKTIASSYVTIKRGCLEATVCYLLGELDLEESTAWIFGEDDVDLPSAAAHMSQSSSEDEDDVIDLPSEIQAQDMESSGTELLVASNSNANVPLPKECGAVFAENGQLVCFFPPKKDKLTLFGSDAGAFDDERWLKGGRVFQGFGRLEGSPASKGKITSTVDENDELSSSSSDSDSFETSSSSSGMSEGGLTEPAFPHFSSWRANVARSRRGPRALSIGYSQRSTAAGSALKDSTLTRPKNVVSIRNVDDILPTTKTLAKEYIIYGEGPEICETNAAIASRHGLRETSDIWRLAKLLLSDEKAYESSEKALMRDPSWMAHPDPSSLRKVDSGLDLTFDDADSGRVSPFFRHFRQGHHHLGGRWLANVMFAYVERLADVQMLGMLTFIFRQASNCSNDLLANHPPPALDHQSIFSSVGPPSSDVATSRVQSSISIPSIMQSGNASGNYSSGDSSTGLAATPLTRSYSNSATPPLTYRPGRTSMDLTDYQPHSLSVSPEHPSRRSFPGLTGGLTTGLARQLSSGASSPPGGVLMKRQSLDESASGPFPTAGVTWGQNTIFGVPGVASSDAAYSDTDDDDEEFPVMKDTSLTVTTKSQHKFDNEGPATVELLDPRASVRFQGYLENYATLLSIWELELRRLELLKSPRTAAPDFEKPRVKLGERRSMEPALPTANGLHVVGKLEGCADHQRRRSNGSVGGVGKCKRCAKTQSKVKCNLCNEAVQGVNAPCLSCGHVLHLCCYKRWFAQPERLCPAGCGCACPTATTEKPVVLFVEDDLPPLQLERKLSPVKEKEELDGWEDLGHSSIGRRSTGIETSHHHHPRSSFGASSLRADGRLSAFGGQMMLPEETVHF